MSVKVTKDGELSIIHDVDLSTDEVSEFIWRYKIQRGFIVIIPEYSRMSKCRNLSDDEQYLVVDLLRGNDSFISLYIFDDKMKLMNNLIFPPNTGAMIGDRDGFHSVDITYSSHQWQEDHWPIEFQFDEFDELVEHISRFVSSIIGNDLKLITNEGDLSINYLA